MPASLDAYLNSEAGSAGLRRDAAETIRQLCGAAVKVRNTLIQGGDSLGSSTEETNRGGDVQKELDVLADRVFLEAAKASPVAFFGSEEQDGAVTLAPNGTLALAIDPLDGSSNITTNVTVGTIFSILPVGEKHRSAPESVFRQKGSAQIAAGFFVYGPQLLLIMTIGNGTHNFIFSPSFGGFVEYASNVEIDEPAKEFAINMSYYRHWDPQVRSYVDDLLAGAEGPRDRDFNMRWVGSMVADCYRIFTRGGIFLYPGDARKGQRDGRLRLLYEANPVAFCVEQAGGGATDGVRRILDIEPEELHQRTPLIFGSKREVELFGRYMDDPAGITERSPLFGRRSLFRN